jgi:hypothetical protein
MGADYQVRRGQPPIQPNLAIGYCQIETAKVALYKKVFP